MRDDYEDGGIPPVPDERPRESLTPEQQEQQAFLRYAQKIRDSQCDDWG
jgi:hypothetical protein